MQNIYISNRAGIRRMDGVLGPIAVEAIEMWSDGETMYADVYVDSDIYARVRLTHDAPPGVRRAFDKSIKSHLYRGGKHYDD